MMERRRSTMALATTSLLMMMASSSSASATSSSSSSSFTNNNEEEEEEANPSSSRLLRNEDLFDIMLSQSQNDQSSPHHRHLSSTPTSEKASTIRENWISISPNEQFLPNLEPSLHRSLAGGYSESNPYYMEQFVDGMAEYDEEAQAWRLLGFIIDCQATDSDEYSQHSQHSGDQDVTITETGCARYLIWAAVSFFFSQ